MKKLLLLMMILLVYSVNATWWNESFAYKIKFNVTEQNISSRVEWLINATLDIPDQRITSTNELRVVNSSEDGEIEYSYDNITVTNGNITKLSLYFKNGDFTLEQTKDFYVYYDCATCGPPSFSNPPDKMLIINETGTDNEYTNWTSVASDDVVYSNTATGGNPDRFWGFTFPQSGSYGHIGGWYKNFNTTNSKLRYNVSSSWTSAGTGANYMNIYLYNGTAISGTEIAGNTYIVACPTDYAWNYLNYSNSSQDNTFNFTMYLQFKKATNSGSGSAPSGYDNIRVWEIFDGSLEQYTEESLNYSINITSINCTSCNIPYGDTTSPYENTSDTTPTFKILTDNSGTCYFDGVTCSTTGSTSHVCTCDTEHAIQPPTDTINLTCENTGNTSFYDTESLVVNINISVVDFEASLCSDISTIWFQMSPNQTNEYNVTADGQVNDNCTINMSNTNSVNGTLKVYVDSTDENHTLWANNVCRRYGAKNLTDVAKTIGTINVSGYSVLCFWMDFIDSNLSWEPDIYVDLWEIDDGI